MKNQQTVTVRIHCRDLPGRRFCEHRAVRLGIQKGREVVDDVLGDAASVTFEFPLRVERNETTGRPNFLGPYAQGTPAERFVYLCWGERTNGGWDGFRRAKVHFKHLDWAFVEEHLKSDRPIEATLGMTDEKGGPLCASVRDDAISWR